MWSKRGGKEKGDRRISLEVARIIASAIIFAQSRVVVILSCIEKRCTVKQKKVLLLLFNLICGIYLLIILSKAIFTREASYKPMTFGKPPYTPPPVLIPRDDTSKLKRNY